MPKHKEDDVFFVIKPKKSKTNILYLKDVEFEVGDYCFASNSFVYLLNQTLNYIDLLGKDVLVLIGKLIQDICMLNGVYINHYNLVKFSHELVLGEPGVILDDYELIVLSKTTINSLLYYDDYYFNIDFDMPANTNALHSPTLVDTKTLKMAMNILLTADHVASHYLAKKINKTEYDFINHTDFENPLFFSLSTWITFIPKLLPKSDA